MSFRYFLIANQMVALARIYGVMILPQRPANIF